MSAFISQLQNTLTMVRSTLIPKDKIIQLQIPKKYIGKKIEVLMFPVVEGGDEQSNKPVKKLSEKYRGSLNSKVANQIRKNIDQSRREWEERFPGC